MLCFVVLSALVTSTLSCPGICLSCSSDNFYCYSCPDHSYNFGNLTCICDNGYVEMGKGCVTVAIIPIIIVSVLCIFFTVCYCIRKRNLRKRQQLSQPFINQQPAYGNYPSPSIERPPQLQPNYANYQQLPNDAYNQRVPNNNRNNPGFGARTNYNNVYSPVVKYEQVGTNPYETNQNYNYPSNIDP